MGSEGEERKESRDSERSGRERAREREERGRVKDSRDMEVRDG